jgi:hypothetical protein
MSIYGGNNLTNSVIAKGLAAEATTATFLSGAADGEVQLVAADGGAVGEGKKFNILQKAGAAAGGVEISDVIEPAMVTKVSVKKHAAEVQKSVSIAGFDGNARANTTYLVHVKLYADAAVNSPDNWDLIIGSYVTGATVPSASDIRDGLVASLNANLSKRGGGELVITTPDTSGTDIVITGAAQGVVRGKMVGRMIEFNVTAKVFDEGATVSENLGLLVATTLAENHNGVGTGKYAVNLEWFTKGFKYEAYRQTGFPADFSERTPYYADINEKYSVITIAYKTVRTTPGVEEQPRTLNILVADGVAGDDAVALTNSIVARLEAFTGKTYADLA